MEIQFNTLLIFPSSRAIRQYINTKKDTNQFLQKTLTIGEFFNNVAINTNKTLISNDLKILYLKQAISNIDISKLGFSSSFSKFYNQSEYIFKFFNELHSEFKTIDDIENSDTYTFYLEHLDILKNIYKEYSNLLKQNNYIDTSILKSDFELNQSYIKDYENVVIYYEGYFSSYEFSLLVEIAKYTKLSIKMYQNQFNTKNIEMFKSINIELEIDNEYTLDISNQIIVSKKNYNNELKNHKIYAVNQRTIQVAFIKYTITNMVKGGINPSNIVLVLPDENFKQYIKLFDDENYFNFAMGNDIRNSHTYKFANAIQSYFVSKEPKDKIRLDFFQLEKEFIEKNISKKWNNKFTKKDFDEIIEFIIKDERNNEILDKLTEIRLSMHNLLFANNSLLNLDLDLKLKDAYKILLNKLNEISLDDTRSGKITVVGILETRGVFYEGVVVVDFNDDKVPKKSVKDKFISSSVKKNSGLPTLKNREDLQKYYYKRLLDNAKQISISYVNDDSNTISRFSTQLFSKINIINNDFSKILNMKNDLKLYNKDIKMNINLSLQEWSATSLKTYLQCKRKYYFNYVLKIKEHDISLAPPAYQVGQIIHNVLEKIYKQNNITYDFLQNELTKYQNKNPYLSLELEVWKKKLKLFVDNEKHRFTNENINIHELEKTFKLKYNNITIKGAIDRIDKLKDNTYAILDYKTSASLKIDTLKTLDNANDFQLELYYLACRDMNISKVAYYDLNDAVIKEELVLKEKLDKLNNIFKALETKEVNFTKCDDTKICQYCTYSTICGL